MKENFPDLENMLEKLLNKSGLIVSMDGEDRIIRDGSIYVEALRLAHNLA